MEKAYFLEELEKITNTGCWEYSIKENKLLWSPQTYAIHGVDQSQKLNVEEAIGFYHEDDRERIERAFNKCVETQKSFRLYCRIYNTKNEVKYVESFGRPRIENGECVSVFGTFKDISKDVYILNSKNKIYKELSGFKNYISNFLILAETDEKGVITSVNDKFCEISGYSHEELIGKTHQVVNSGHHGKGFFKNMWETLKRNEPWQGMICNRKKNGDLYWVMTFIFPQVIEEKVIGYTSLRYDMTEQKKLEDEINLERERAAFSSQLAAVGEMSAGIAHEINNPLTIIMGLSQSLAKDETDEKRSKKFSMVDKAAKRILKITKGLLKLAQKSKTDLHQKNSLKDILFETLEFCQEALAHKGILLTFDGFEDDLYLKCNDVKISQIILNLINNAKDAIFENSYEEKWVKISLKSDSDNYYLSVTDSGPAITKKMAKQILEPFFTTKEKGKGTGLGLPLVSRFASEHGGELLIDTETTNACFIVKLPKN
ncbi:MAG: PAS domain-containing sensor histidine kinase [Oligoflexia bacterium]|nr:PAS domain-containing sensor histidine kinase [Oligoflexia bacterium]